MSPDSDFIAITRIAKKHRKHKAAIFKIANKLHMEITKQVSSDSRGQKMAFVKEDDARIIDEYLKDRQATRIDEDNDFIDLENFGNFYLIQLEPVCDPNRFKVGFAMDVNERLIKHKCSAPFSKILKSWKCKLLWEKTAIDCVTMGCDKLHTEVFRSNDSIESVLIKCDAFFSLFNNCKNSAQQVNVPEPVSPVW